MTQRSAVPSAQTLTRTYGRTCVCMFFPTIQADDVKLPAVIVFRGAQNTGVLSERIMNTLAIPDHIITRSSCSAR